MSKVTVLRFGSKKNPNIKTIGGLLLFASLLLFLNTGNGMFESWDQIKVFPSCLEEISGIDEVSQLKLIHCKQSLYNSTGISLAGNEARISQRQAWFAVLTPIAFLFFWAILFLIGLMLYKTGMVVFPVRHDLIDFKKKKK